MRHFNLICFHAFESEDILLVMELYLPKPFSYNTYLFERDLATILTEFLLAARIPAYLYPFLSSTETELPFELLRINSLGVIDALIKDDDPQVIHFLLESEIFPLCLRCMELGHETSKQVAALTVSKILQQQQGLYYCGAFVDRFYAVAHVLRRVVDNLPENPQPPLLRNIVRCYLLLTKMPRASGALRRCFPASLTDGTFTNILREDPQTMRHLQHLLYKVNLGHGSN
ncbi:hypothetical protein F0562_011142 [Nyssa sinensis]|uniref:CCR4-NOT transcription complex subunit 9 n=1 Tax=Nyssa sinensis TaxID=561372 RepID=A0A5J5A346_9ASTE|nr:hypothetical protein F0562_011142 [Nyssa sinensis]